MPLSPRRAVVLRALGGASGAAEGPPFGTSENTALPMAVHP
jgi:hypothetical protein